jgi:hypothetical protein
MDPFTALGPASSIAQLLDFGAKVLREAKKLYSDSESERSNHQIRNLALDLGDLCQNLKQKAGLDVLHLGRRKRSRICMTLPYDATQLPRSSVTYWPKSAGSRVMRPTAMAGSHSALPSRLSTVWVQSKSYLECWINIVAN